MTWDYRIMHLDGVFKLVEAYYEGDKVVGYVECDGSWLTFEERTDCDLELMAGALQRPTLYLSDIQPVEEPDRIHDELRGHGVVFPS